LLYNINQQNALFHINTLIFNYLKDLLHVLNLRVHLQEDSCIYSYCIVCLTCISMSSPVGKKGVFIHNLRPTGLQLFYLHNCLYWCM